MTVKTLNQDQKDIIIHQFGAKMRNQKQLAKQYGTSERTIARVLAEAGVHSAVPRMTGDAARAQQALAKHNLNFADLPGLLDALVNYGLLKTTDNGITYIAQPQPAPKTVDPIDTNADPRDELRPKAQIDVGTPWRVGEYWSSANPDKKVLVLSTGSQEIQRHAADSSFIRWVAGSNITSKPVTKEQVVEFAMQLPEEDFGLLHSKIITARVARASNTHVQTAMLNLQQKVEQNARDTEKLRGDQ